MNDERSQQWPSPACFCLDSLQGLFRHPRIMLERHCLDCPLRGHFPDRAQKHHRAPCAGLAAAKLLKFRRRIESFALHADHAFAPCSSARNGESVVMLCQTQRGSGNRLASGYCSEGMMSGALSAAKPFIKSPPPLLICFFTRSVWPSAPLSPPPTRSSAVPPVNDSGSLARTSVFNVA